MRIKLFLMLLSLLRPILARGTRTNLALWNQVWNPRSDETMDICVKKVVLVTEIIYDEELECQHLDHEQCYDVYDTVFNTTEAEECKTSFIKKCIIEFRTVVRNHTMNVCDDIIVHDCNNQDVSEDVCITQYETVCQRDVVVIDEHHRCKTVRDHRCGANSKAAIIKGAFEKRPPKLICSKSRCHPEAKNVTTCQSVPRTLCGKQKCPKVKKSVCRDEIRTLTVDVPHEQCEMTPREKCQTVRKIVPNLVAKRICTHVPRETCSTVFRNPRKVTRPVVRRWCKKST